LGAQRTSYGVGGCCSLKAALREDRREFSGRIPLTLTLSQKERGQRGVNCESRNDVFPQRSFLARGKDLSVVPTGLGGCSEPGPSAESAGLFSGVPAGQVQWQSSKPLLAFDQPAFISGSLKFRSGASRALVAFDQPGIRQIGKSELRWGAQRTSYGVGGCCSLKAALRGRGGLG
jgi:hypothetical protein